MLPPLDTQRGGEVLEEIVRRDAPELVVLDTMARVVQGDENDAGTYTNFYAHSGVRLKRRASGCSASTTPGRTPRGDSAARPANRTMSTPSSG